VDERASFGVWLRERRKALRLTQEELAERISCSSAMVRKIEAGERAASRQMADLLAESFGIVAAERAAFVQFAQGQLSTRVAERALWQTLHTVQAHPTNLASPLTRLIGRERELERLHELLLLNHERLFTLTGPPGIGKTRLSQQVGIELLDRFEHGVFFVSLAPVTNPDRVLSAIAGVLGIPDVGTEELLGSLQQSLNNKQMLLLLDNFEQVLDASPVVMELLGSCPELKVLVTSREALHVYGEHQFPVPPLATADPLALPPIQTLETIPGIALFIERARAVKPDFALTEENARAITAVCARLDGLPLAIELAAARIRLLSLQEMQTRFESRLSILSGGPRNLPARQRTLRAAIDWSYSLLSDREQTLFAQLGVFVGGCTLSAAEAICQVEAGTGGDSSADSGQAPTFDVSAGLASLLDKNLLKREEGVEGESRFTMLELIREFALERLQSSGKEGEVRTLHAEYFLALAEAAELQVWREEQQVWLDRLERDHDNLRATYVWLLNVSGVELCLRLVGALAIFWDLRGYWNEGITKIEEVLSRPTTSEYTIAKAQALQGVGMLYYNFGNRQMASAYFEQSVAVWRAVGDKRGLAFALADWVYAVSFDKDSATSKLEESLQLYRQLDDTRGLAFVLLLMSDQATSIPDVPRARSLLEESLGLFEKAGDSWGIAWSLMRLTELTAYEGDLPGARIIGERSLAMFHELNIKEGKAIVLSTLASIACDEGEPEHARALYEEAITLWRELGNQLRLGFLLANLGHISRLQGDSDAAISLYQEAHSLLSTRMAGADGIHSTFYELFVQGHLEQVMGEHEQALATFRACLKATDDRMWKSGQEWRTAACLVAISAIFLLQGHSQQAARLLAVASRAQKTIRSYMLNYGLDYSYGLALVRTKLDEKSWSKAWAEGREMTMQEAIEYAFGDPAMLAEYC
jgi:predicted ATPase/DNA-binding XRE family transcriptional regulator